MSIKAVPEDVQWLPHPRCVKPHALWSAPDKDATEVEVTHFVAALVRLLKPSVVVETGTYQGHTTSAIAEALAANTTGRVWTFETNQARALAAYEALRDHVDAGRVVIHNTRAVPDMLPQGIELAFLDSGMRDRDEDMRNVWPRLVQGGIALVHDASPDRPPGKVRPPGPHAVFDFATPRGLLAFQKPWS